MEIEDDWRGYKPINRANPPVTSNNLSLLIIFIEWKILMKKRQEANQRYSEAAEHINQEIDQLNSRRAALGKKLL